ncbi:24575_t:CDS:2, partial [Gigaspora margarita]
MSVNDSFSSKPLETTSAKRIADKVKGRRPRMLIWDDFIEGENDGHWGDSLYDFIITTPNHHKYLYALANYLGEHQTGNFIDNKISDIIEKIGPYQFAAIVIDNGSNVHIAQEIIHNDYSQVLNIHCVAYSINLLIADL